MATPIGQASDSIVCNAMAAYSPRSPECRQIERRLRIIPDRLSSLRYEGRAYRAVFAKQVTGSPSDA